MTNTRQLPRSTPEKQGISSAAILGFINELEQNIRQMHSFMLLRHGCLVAEGWWSPFAPDRPHMLFSLSKSFTSTAIGLAMTEGHLTVDDPVISFFPDDLPAKVSKNLAAMRVKHLLSMSTGHDKDTMGRIEEGHGSNWVKAFLALDVEHEPGSSFLYNTGATYMLSAILQKVTGTKLIDYLQPRLFEPLGIQDAAWETSPQGINMGGFGLSVKTENIARFGQMYLQNGVWEGKSIVPSSWVKAASSFQVDNSNTQTNPDWSQGYGYQFWRCRHNAYRGDGAFGQYCIVMPDQDVVLAITSGVGDMQVVLNVVWDKLLPALNPNPLAENPQSYQKLSHRLASLAITPPSGQVTSPNAAEIYCKPYAIDPNPLTTSFITFEFGEQVDSVRIQDARGEHLLTCGKGVWLEGTSDLMERTPLVERGPLQVACSGIWTADDTYVISMLAYNTPFENTMTCQFSSGSVTINSAMNVSFGPTTAPTLVGHLAAVTA